jgi:spore maturation protein CgeB
VPAYRHAVVHGSATFMLNLNRAAMAPSGLSPPARGFEAAATGCCILTDAWAGIKQYFAPAREILVAERADEIVPYLGEEPPARARALAQVARQRVQREHMYAQRALLERALVTWLHAST